MSSTRARDDQPRRDQRDDAVAILLLGLAVEPTEHRDQLGLTPLPALEA
jgi:hypothetical protein